MTILSRNKLIPEVVCCSNNNSKKSNLSFLFIWESELEQLCGQANDFGNIETGGECYGLFSHGGRPVIMLVTPSSPDAVHQRAHFQQDIAFLKRTNLYLLEEFGLNFLGTHHSHHKLRIEGLSLGDIRSTHAIATKNGYCRMCQILLTFDDTPYRLKRSELKIKIHPFLYSDAQNGKPIRCLLKLIPGISPIRKSIKSDTTIPELRHHYQFPQSNMIYDSLESRKDRIESENNLPEEIIDTIHTLPENILRKLQYRTMENLLFLTLPIKHNRRRLSIVYETTPPYSVQMISILTAGKHTDVTNQIFSSHEQISLVTLYQRCERFIQLSSQNDEKLNLDETDQSIYHSREGKKVWEDGKQKLRSDQDDLK